MRLVVFLLGGFFFTTVLFSQKITIINNPFDDDRFNFISRKSISNKDSVLYYQDKGYFNFENKHVISSGYRWYFFNTGLSSKAITRYKADIIQLSGVQNYGYGIVINAVDGNNYILFSIASNGYYSISATSNSVINKISNGWIKSSLVKTGLNVINQLIIEKNGDDYNFLLNDVSIKQIKLIGQKFAANLGLSAQGGMNVAMDNVEILQWVPDNKLLGKIEQGYTPINTYPVASKPIPTKSKKSELYSISISSYQNVYGLKDKDGYRLVDPVHTGLDYQHGFIKVGYGKQNAFGIFDEQGNMVIPPIMQSINIHHSKEGTYFICRSEKGFYGLVDQTGKTVLPFVYNYIDQISEGLVYVKSFNEWGVVNLTGLPVIGFGNIEDADERKKTTYRRTKQFFNGRMMTIAKVSDGGKMGIIDTKGNWVIKPKYESISRVDTNRSYIISVIDPNDKRRIKYGIIDYNGNEIVPPIYSSISTEGKNYIVADGVDPYGYDFSEFADDDFFEEIDKADQSTNQIQKWGMLGPNGKILIPVKQLNISSTWDKQIVMVDNEFGKIEKNTKMNKALYDYTGKMLLNLNQYDVFVFDSTKFITKPKKEYRRMEPYYGDGLMNVAKAGKWGFVDKTGKVIIPFQYDHASAYYRGAAIVKKGDEWYYINKSAKKITAEEANPETGIVSERKEMPPIRPGVL